MTVRATSTAVGEQATIIARVGEGIVTTVGSGESHGLSPDAISHRVQKGLDPALRLIYPLTLPCGRGSQYWRHSRSIRPKLIKASPWLKQQSDSQPKLGTGNAGALRCGRAW